MITSQKLQAHIDKIQSEFLTSNNIINRIDYPYYYNHSSVPDPLTKFKKRLHVYRQQCAQLIAKQAELPFPNAPHRNRNFSEGTFAHQLTVALAVSQFGIGDCGECMAKLGLALIQDGFGDLAFIGVKFLEAKEGMEQYHAFIVANLPTLSLPTTDSGLSVYDLFKMLPTQALIGDAFLGLSFSPAYTPENFIRYLKAYGGKTEIIECYHFYNLPRDSKIFGGYQLTAEKIVKEIKSKQPLLEEDAYNIRDRIKIKDTILIDLLKDKSKLPFYGVRNQEYKVDAIVELKTKEEKAAAFRLQKALRGHGQFFRVNNQTSLFVLEGINLSTENPKLIQHIKACQL